MLLRYAGDELSVCTTASKKNMFVKCDHKQVQFILDPPDIPSVISDKQRYTY